MRKRAASICQFGAICFLALVTLALPANRVEGQDAFDLNEFDAETIIRYELSDRSEGVFRRDMMQLYMDLALQAVQAKISRTDLSHAMMRDELEELRARMADQESERREILLMVRELGVNAESVQASIQRLEQAKAEAQIDIEGREARRKAIHEELARVMEEIAESEESDPILKQLQVLYELRLRNLDRQSRLREQGVVSESDYAKATAEVAEAELRMIERQEMIKQTDNDEYVLGIRSELVAVTFDLAEIGAKLSSIKAQLENLYRAEELLMRVPRDQNITRDADLRKMMQLEENLNHARSELRSLEIQYKTYLDLTKKLAEQEADSDGDTGGEEAIDDDSGERESTGSELTGEGV